MVEKIEQSQKQRVSPYRAVVKKLNNFRFTAMLVAIISTVAAIYALLSFFLYHFCGDINIYDIRDPGFQSTQQERYLGMLLFFACLFSIVCAIFAVYNLIPALQNKTKIVPSRTPLIVGFAGTVFQIIVIILMIKLAFTYEPVPKTKVAMIVSLPFGILSAIGTGLYMVPILSCSFFMPEIKR